MEARTYEVETSLTLDYRRSSWGLERIVLDSISNHLPADSNGARTSVKLKQDGQYLDLKEADPTKPTEEVVFEDNGFGYDAGLLSILFSTKVADPLSVGQFGEGLKLVATAALRNGINVEYRSRNWFATPFARHETVGGHEIDRLCFRVTENGDHLAGSRTVFSNPSGALIAEIFQLPDKVLAFNSQYVELHNERNNIDYIPAMFYAREFNGAVTKSAKYESRIIDLGTDFTSIFVKGIRVQSYSALFSYDLGLDDVSPDRIFVDREKLLDSIELLLKRCSNTAVIERVLREAQQNPEAYYVEFEAFRDRKLPNRTGILGDFSYIGEIGKHAKPLEGYFGKVPENLWVRTFRDMFGKDAVIASQNIDTNSDAEIVGYRPVRLNRAIADYLLSNGVINADQIQNNQEYKWADIGELTESERGMLDRVKEINQVVLGEPRDVDVRVYSGLYTQTGREIESSNGMQMTNPDGTKYIGIKRARLQTFTDFAQTYIHELGHLITGAGDFDRRFVDFAYNALAKIVGAQLGKTKK